MTAIAILVAALVVAADAAKAADVTSSPPIEASTAADRASLEKIVYDFEQAWNAHDMVAFANLFWDDAEWVHWRGGLWSGKKEIYEGHKSVHETYYKTSHASVQGIEAVHFLAPNVAYVRVRSDMTGDARFPGETFRYRRTMIMSKREGKWLISKGHNTRIIGNAGVDWRPTPGGS